MSVRWLLNGERWFITESSCFISVFLRFYLSNFVYFPKCCLSGNVVFCKNCFCQILRPFTSNNSDPWAYTDGAPGANIRWNVEQMLVCGSTIECVIPWSLEQNPPSNEYSMFKFICIHCFWVNFTRTFYVPVLKKQFAKLTLDVFV